MNRKLFLIGLYVFSLCTFCTCVFVTSFLNKTDKIRTIFFEDICFFEPSDCPLCRNITEKYFSENDISDKLFLKRNFKSDDLLYHLKCEGIINSLHLFPLSLSYIKKKKNIIYAKTNIQVSNSIIILDFAYDHRNNSLIYLNGLDDYALFLKKKL